MEPEFKVGDVVQLKSGGPAMTIEGIGKYGFANTNVRAKCTWFDGKKMVDELFELATLKPANN
jgi:uncharacterized protein YodC (DUF2158 family)